MGASAVQAVTAWVVLGGHPSRPALLELSRLSPWAWAARTAGLLALWAGGSIATFALTFDPFLTALPFFMVGAVVWRAFRGRYRVYAFRGDCPRCGHALTVKPGTAIGLPHPLVCYQCHHEPRLAAA
ncbi:MAG: hypothetical protein JWM27_4586 [Gemmatimonadetes bacterium]|nr:hypothetical protein [Gemmatimonadota bacterium]